MNDTVIVSFKTGKEKPLWNRFSSICESAYIYPPLCHWHVIKQIIAGLNTEFSFSNTGSSTKTKSITALLFTHMCCIAVIQLYKYTDTWNIRIRTMFICIEIPKHWRLSLFRYETFITFLTFRFSTRGEKHNFYYADCSIWPNGAQISRRPLDWPRPAKKSTRFVQHQISTHWTARLGVRISTNCFFLKITPNPQPIASGYDVIHIHSPTSYPVFFIMTSMIVTSPPAWRPALNVCPYPCTKLNSSKPN